MSALRTRLCRELGIDYPIWSVGFGGAGPELVAAVSGAGGFGVLGANGLPAGVIAALVARTRELTDRPFGLNFIIGDHDEQRRAVLTAEVRAAAAAKVAAVVLFWGDPAPYVPLAHAGGVKVVLGRRSPGRRHGRGGCGHRPRDRGRRARSGGDLDLGAAAGHGGGGGGAAGAGLGRHRGRGRGGAGAAAGGPGGVAEHQGS